MQTLRQSFYATTVDDGSGNTGGATIRIQPAAKEWRIDNLNVRCATRIHEGTAVVYQNFVGAQYQVDLTRSGSSGDTSDTIHYLHDGDALIVVWTGADIGQQVTLTIVGQEYLPGEGGF